MAKNCILIIEDDPDGLKSVQEVIRDAGYETLTAGTGEEGVRLLKVGGVDVILSDLMLPDINGVEVLSRVRMLDADVPVLIMTAYGSVATAVDALKSGAYDYITKPLDLDDLQLKVARAVEARRLRGEVARLKQTVSSRYSAASMVAESALMKAVLQQIESVANTDATVFISGESGTGKEVVARAIHADGRRKDGPFVAVNCGAFAESLLDSELFGHEKGAFTGATQQRKGAFERAEGGTLFLDEIGDAPASVQVKLLRVLEERELWRVGGQEPIQIDVRVMSASNRDLDELVGSGDFREDLFYRLKVVGIDVPPLRERRDDIRPLVDRFVIGTSKDHGRSITGVDGSFYGRLEGYDWPGNVRQLRNVVESSVVMARGSLLKAEDVRLGDEGRKVDAGKMLVPENMTFAELEREILSQVLSRYEGNRTLAAEKLNLSRRTIQRKVKEYNLPF